MLDILLIVFLFLGAICGAMYSLGISYGRSRNQRGRQRQNNLQARGRFSEQGAKDDSYTHSSKYSNLLRIFKPSGPKRRRAKEPTIDELLFMAGRFTPTERESFLKARRKAPFILGAVGALAGYSIGLKDMGVLGLAFGILLGLHLPMKMLRGWVASQHEDLSFYLPLMIEQVTIGVSSSLDVGPCISKIVQMADERGSHNPATELLKVALSYVKSGLSLEQALIDVGRASGCAEFKQALIALSQVTKFGGEITKQLQELADAVNSQREARIEADIRKLELKATAPVSLVFLAYIILLGLGIAAQFISGIGG